MQFHIIHQQQSEPETRMKRISDTKTSAVSSGRKRTTQDRDESNMMRLRGEDVTTGE